MEQLAGGGPLHVGAKRTGPYVDRVFRDSLGREVLLRGYNVTSRTLVTRGGLTPFTDLEQARTLTDRLRQRTGANVGRFLISWEGTHPEVDRIDTDYLRTIAEQIQVLTDRGIYVVLDYHQDNFSRHLVPHGHGDGAPAWVTPGLPAPSLRTAVRRFGPALPGQSLRPRGVPQLLGQRGVPDLRRPPPAAGRVPLAAHAGASTSA